MTCISLKFDDFQSVIMKCIEVSIKNEQCSLEFLLHEFVVMLKLIVIQVLANPFHKTGVKSCSNRKKSLLS